MLHAVLLKSLGPRQDVLRWAAYYDSLLQVVLCKVAWVRAISLKALPLQLAPANNQ